MKKTILFLLITLTSFVYSQKVFKSKEFQFAMQEPVNWIETNNKTLLKNLEKFDFSEASFSKIITTNKGSILLNAFYKYNPKTHPGIIPTVQINVRLNIANNFEQFKSAIVLSSNDFKKYFQDFEFITAPTEIEISGIKSVYFVSKYSMKTQNGAALQVRSRTYAIPFKNYFFQLNFIDGQTGEDCNAEFDELVKSITIGKEQ